MKERPILFSAPMVRAILAGAKTQTRRIVKPQPREVWGYGVPLPHIDKERRFGIDAKLDAARNAQWVPCPYGAPGDQLWVRETWQLFDPHPDGDLFVVGQERLARGRKAPYVGCVNDRSIEWTAAYRADGELEHPTDGPACWRPGIHMPRWASRITLEVTGVRVERLHAITEDDARAEGVEPFVHPSGLTSYRDGFARLWSEINDAFDENVWVWVVEFRRIEAASEERAA